MNLDDMLKEASIIDHSWYGNGMLKPGEPTFDAEAEGIRRRNNIKPELEVEFGMAGPLIDLDEPAGIVTRNIPEESLGDTDPVILFARDQMNRGMMGKKLLVSLRSKFGVETLKKASANLREMFALEGIVGCIAVDGRGYKDCKEAMRSASHSPYKRFIRHVVGCQCGDPHQVPSKGTSSLVGAENRDGSLDGFLASDEPHKVEMVSHCRSTMLPILSFRGDLDPSELDQTLVELTNMTGLPEGEVKQVWADAKDRKLSGLQVVQAAFRRVNALCEATESKRAAGAPVKADDVFQMGVAGQEVDVVAPIPVSPDVEMTPQMGDVPQFGEAIPDEGIRFDEDVADIELGNEPVQPLEIDMRREELEV